MLPVLPVAPVLNNAPPPVTKPLTSPATVPVVPICALVTRRISPASVAPSSHSAPLPKVVLVPEPEIEKRLSQVPPVRWTCAPAFTTTSPPAVPTALRPNTPGALPASTRPASTTVPPE